MSDKKVWLHSLVVDFMETSTANRMGEKFGEEKMWDRPVVGFANGADPIFAAYKDRSACGVEHWTPSEIFANAYPDEDFSPGDLTVISWILPQTSLSKADCAKSTTDPAERWARARILGEPVNDLLREYMTNTLHKNGYQAISPVLHPEWTRLETPEQIYTSKWSERHMAHAAGLGTFGLCDALITPVGKAIRLGSIVVKVDVAPDPRPYTDIHAYCLYFSKGTCGACIKRCPVGSISKDGRDKRSCRVFLRGPSTDYVKEHFDLDGYGCGMCQTAVPCEHGIPTI